MLAFLYLCVCAVTGMALLAICVPDVRRLYLACAPSVKAIENIPSTLFVVSAGTVAGMMLVPFINYFVVLGLSYFVAGDKLCMKIGLMVTAAISLWVIFSCLMLVNRRRIKRDDEGEQASAGVAKYVNKPSNTLFYSFVILLITVVAAFLMFYTYRIDRNTLLNGYSTFSDLSPHTAMVSSFGKGFNFPTEYIHFSGDGINYHFMFYFLAGMLEFLGFPIDYALNIPSIIAMVCAMILLGLLASLLSGRRLAFAFSPVLVFLRSSLNVFIHIRDLMAGGNSLSGAISEILSESSWYEVTPYDSWGVWAINVYPNQRHLMLGVGAILVCIILFIPFVRRLCISVMSAGSFSGFFKALLFSRNAWLARKDDPLSSFTVALFTCLMVIVMPYFHGSCLIAMLLVLFGMALISESRLLHLMVAVCAVASSFLQTMAFSGGAQNVVRLQYNPGFILYESSYPVTSGVIANWGKYIITVTGATLAVAVVCTLILFFHDLIRKRPIYRFFLFLAFLNPLIFAFMYQVSLEMLANHKFIQVSVILADVFVALFLANLFIVPGRRRPAAVLAAAESTGTVATPVSSVPAPATDSESLEDGKAKTEEDELPPVIPEKSGKEELHFGDDDEAPFEVITDDEDKKKDTEDKTISDDTDDSDDADVAFVSEEDDKKDDGDDKDAKEEKEESSDAPVLEKFPSETSVSMRPGNLIKNDETKEEEKDEESKEDDSSKDESAKDEPAKEEESSGKDEPVKEDVPADDADLPEEIDELPFEVLDEENNDDDSSEKALDKVKEDQEISEEKASASDDDKKSDEDEPAAMVLEHEEIEQEKPSGLPGPVWFFFEIFGVLAGLILLVALIGTGISEWATYININSTPMAVNVNSPLTDWVEKNTEPDDVFLTPEWSMNRFLLAGRPMYYGWPYYAWSAGHDTDTRDRIYCWLISGCGGDINEFKRYCKERGIRYLIADPEFEDGDYGDGVYFNREFFEKNLQQVAYFTEENTIIYKIY